MAKSKDRLTLQQAEALFPNEWVIFVEPRIDRSTSSFVDGVVYWHGRSQAEAYRRSSAIKGDRAKFFMGSIPYRGVILEETNAVGKKVA